MTSLFPKGLGGHTKRYIYFSRLLSAILDQKISGIPQKYRLLAYRLLYAATCLLSRFANNVTSMEQMYKCNTKHDTTRYNTGKLL